MRLIFFHICRYNTSMAHFDELFKHLADYAPGPLAALALNTQNVEVGDLNTESHDSEHHSDLTFQIRLPDRDEDAILHIEAQTDESREKPMALRVLMVFLRISMRRTSIPQFSIPAGTQRLRILCVWRRCVSDPVARQR